MIKAKKVDEAVQFTQQVYSTFANDPLFLYWRGSALLYAGNQDLAKKHFTQALNIDPDHVLCQKAIKNLKRLDQAKEEANTLFKNGNLEAAIEAFTQCLDLDPLNFNFNATIYLNRAIAHSKLKNNLEALGDLNKCVQAKEDYAKAYVKRGEVNLALENYEEAVRDFEKAKSLVSTPNEFNVG